MSQFRSQGAAVAALVFTVAFVMSRWPSAAGAQLPPDCDIEEDGNFNLDPGDDFRMRDGRVLPAPIDLDLLAEEWRIKNRAESYFHYQEDESPETFHLTWFPLGMSEPAVVSEETAAILCAASGLDGDRLVTCTRNIGLSLNQSFVLSAMSAPDPVVVLGEDGRLVAAAAGAMTPDRFRELVDQASPSLELTGSPAGVAATPAETGPMGSWEF